jgi:hypothetical protein
VAAAAFGVAAGASASGADGAAEAPQEIGAYQYFKSQAGLPPLAKSAQARRAILLANAIVIATPSP